MKVQAAGIGTENKGREGRLGRDRMRWRYVKMVFVEDEWNIAQIPTNQDLGSVFGINVI